jgi:spore coat polysaccharide biosynthesis protein SpsF
MGSRVLCIVQARMGSTRLPGKVLKPILGKTFFGIQLERMLACKPIDQIVVATTTHERDLPILALAEKMGLSSFCGSEDNVLERFYETSQTHPAEVIVRCTSDCPVIDPIVMDKVVRKFLEGGWDYVSNTLKRSFPIGMDIEVFSRASLVLAQQKALLPLEREHVTPYIYRNPQSFKMEQVVYHEDQAKHRLTLDTQEDLEFLTRIISALYPKNPLFTLENILDLLKKHPDWARLNAHVEQKSLECE